MASNCLSTKDPEEKNYVSLVAWLAVMWLFFIGHKAGLFYAHVKVLETLDEVSLEFDQLINLALKDGFPSYLPIVVIFFLVVGAICMSCGKSDTKKKQKKYIIGSSLFAIVFACLCTIVQIAVVLFKDVSLFLNKKAGGLAECYCLLDSVTGFVWTSAFSTVPSSDLDLYWCRCNVPGEEYPVGFSVADPNMTIDASFLKNFLEKDEFEGTVVDTKVVETKEELLRLTDNEFQDLTMLLAMAELSVFFVVLRMPMLYVMGKAMARKLSTKAVKPDQNAEEARPAVVNIVKKYAVYKESKKNLLTIMEGFIEIVVYAFIESLDAYSLLDDVVEHRYTFGGNRMLTLFLLILILINNIIVNTSSIAIFFKSNSEFETPLADYLKSKVDVDTVGIKTALKITKLVMVILSNLPFAGLRCYLLYAYDGFEGAQVGSVYVIFIIKEIVLSVMGIIEFVLDHKKQHLSESQTDGKPTNAEENGIKKDDMQRDMLIAIM